MSFSKIFKLIKTSIIFLLMFFLIRHETLQVSGVKLSILWKVPIILYLIVFNLKYIGNKFLMISFLLGISLMINTGFPGNSISDFSELVEILSIPLVYFFAKEKFKNKPQKLQRIIILTSCFFIISAIPFIFNFLESTVEVGATTSLENIGGSGAKLSGIFFHPNIASKVFVVSVLVIIYFYYDGVKTKFLWVFFILIGFYAVYQTFSRTAWITLLIGILYMLFLENKSKKFLYKLAPIFLVLFLVLNNNIVNTDAIYNKLTGSTITKDNASGDLNQLSSNRLVLSIGAWEIFKKSNFIEKSIGYGKIGALNEMEKATGLYLTAHNRILEIFLIGGLITLILYLLYLYIMYKIIFLDKSNLKIKSLLKVLFVLMIIYQIPSHGFPLWVNYIFALLLAYHKILINEQRIQTYIYNRKL